jgi:lipopolysaccharide/colanic/teichoic acid biosynthesis glycosyltransferase
MALPLLGPLRRTSQQRAEFSSSLQRADAAPATQAPARHSHRERILEADLFRTAIAREQKRVDRSAKAFAVLTVELTDGSSAELMRLSAAAISAGTRCGDIIGWLRQDRAIGVLLTDIHALNFPQQVTIESRIRRALASCADAPDIRRVAVGLQVHNSTRRTARAERSSSHARVHDVLKRMLDLIGGISLLAVLSPLLLLIAAAVKLTSKGPVLFRQERIGQGMKPFRMLKFRTMRPDSGHAVHQAYVTQFIKGGDESAAAPGVFKLTNDRRVTPIGQLLRKTSLDELPQLWNVVVGDMSLVGPRPPIKYEVDQYKGWHLRRVLDAKPGVTGLWQVTGRSRTTFDEMVRLDLRYARTYSVWTDLRILLATPRAVIAGKGAC